MKKSILITCTVLATLSVAAFGFLTRGSAENLIPVKTPCYSAEHIRTDYFSRMIPQSMVELFYDFGPRFMQNRSKEDLKQVTSMADFLTAERIESITSFQSVSVIILDSDYNFVTTETSQGPGFNRKQLDILHNSPYSTDILVQAKYKERNALTGKEEDGGTTPHLTIIPENQAEYRSGNDALIAHVRDNTLKFAASIEEDKLKPGKVRFTISQDGKVVDVLLESTSGYDSFDKEVMNLISKMPGTWKPAANTKGEKVEQELVFSFGIIGC